MANWGNILSRGNVEDRRGLVPAAIGGISLTGIALVALFQFLAGGDVTDVLRTIEQLPPVEQRVAGEQDRGEYVGEDSYEVFASTVLGSNNDTWRGIFSRNNRNYQEPTLVLFRTATESGCGGASSEVGPHYCPYDETIYLDETFFDELTTRFGAQGGDVAQAYVIAHEVGHHVQNQLGGLDQADSIAVELQADCYAGIWANSIRNLGVLEAGEIGEAMDAAAAVGDDRIQKRVVGRVNPETWTHGSSEQRVSAFTRGNESGQLTACNNL